MVSRASILEITKLRKTMAGLSVSGHEESQTDKTRQPCEGWDPSVGRHAFARGPGFHRGDGQLQAAFQIGLVEAILLGFLERIRPQAH